MRTKVALLYDFQITVWYNADMSNRLKNKKYFSKRSYHGGSRGMNPTIKIIVSAVGILLAAAVLFVCVIAVMVLLEKNGIDTPISPDGITAKYIDKLHNSGLFGFDSGDVLVCSPTPFVTPEPTATPDPMASFDGEAAEKELVMPSDSDYKYFGAPYCYDGRIICSAGKIIGGKSLLCALISYDIASGEVTELDIESKNGQLLNPVFNESWLIYLDGNTQNGGGDICVVDLKSGNMTPTVIKTVYLGQPEFKLDGDYFTWVERTGTSKDKVFVCHIPSQEITVVAAFTKSNYGTSTPYMFGGRVIWANDDNISHEGGRVSSAIEYIDLENGSINSLLPDVYVHDPEYNGTYYAWINANYSSDSELYIYNGVDAPMLIDSGVVEFGISEDYIAYGKDEAVWVYIFASGQIYRITPERESTQFLGTSGGYIMWMDVTSRERDVIRYASLPEF